MTTPKEKHGDLLIQQIINIKTRQEATEGLSTYERTSYKLGHRDARHAAAELVAATLMQREGEAQGGVAPSPAQPGFDVDAMLRACVPGGDICDPQQVADAIRAYVAHGVKAAPANNNKPSESDQ